jgi:dTDP-4-dehydrorhamnose reductase
MKETEPMKPLKRIVVVGAAGRLGTSLVQALEQEHTVIPLARKELDLSSPSSIERVLGSLDYDSLIITGALTAVDYCETNEKEAFLINAEGPGRIAEISANKGAHVTYVSTDFVYDGSKSPPYLETDPASPICVYGTSKLRGEENVLAASSKNLVVRVSWLFGRGKSAFPEWIIHKSCAESEVTLPYDKIGCPTSCEDLIQALLSLSCNRARDAASGVFNFCNPEPCTWQEWGQFCIDTAKQVGLPILCETIQGIAMDTVPAFVAKRPLNSAMCVKKFVEFSGHTPRHWQEAVSEHLLSGDLFREYTPTRMSGV